MLSLLFVCCCDNVALWLYCTGPLVCPLTAALTWAWLRVLGVRHGEAVGVAVGVRV